MAQKIKIDSAFGKRLREIRISHGYTQEQIVVKLQLLNLDISRSAYAQIECGTYNIKISELRALKDIYNITYDEFFVLPKEEGV
ncbi:MAG: helix-turn-helix domain-containing protein [Lachnospiraceae bacterium]|nr:helix-turn-helix domain-containing protein [Lachnospiraceae bacterium]